VLLGFGFVAGAAFLAIVAPRTIATAEALAAILPLFALWLVVGGFSVAGLDQIVALVLVAVVIAVAPLVLVLEARAALAQHAEIMIGELQIIFGLHAVAGELRVARHALVFFEELRGIAPLAIVLPVPRLSAEVLTPLPPAAASAAALTIVDQMPTSLRS
jgi:hypothetical protein